MRRKRKGHRGTTHCHGRTATGSRARTTSKLTAGPRTNRNTLDNRGGRDHQIA